MNLFNRTTKLRVRRAFRRRRRAVEDISYNTEDNFDRLFFRRLNRLIQVRRFIGAWLVFILLLIFGVVAQNEFLAGQYLSSQPKAGGTFSEGVLGTFTNASPIYASGAVDTAVARLVFNGLFRYDDENNLVPDLAQNYVVNDKATEFTVTLRDDVVWHDDKPLTADDVVFTYGLIQNPDAKSVLYSSWTSIKVVKIDDRTVRFTLPSSLSSFPYSLTNGIVPQHKLGSIAIGQLREDNFNTISPVGTGPFKFSDVEVTGTTPEDRHQTIFFSANSSYHRGRPKLDRFVVTTYSQAEQLAQALVSKQVHGASGLDGAPNGLNRDASYEEYNVPLNGQTMVFFKTSTGVLADPAVRQALVHGANPLEVLGALQYPALPVTSPLLKSHIGFAADLQQRAYDETQAKKLLDDAGWITDPTREGLRKKGETYLRFALTTLDSPEYIAVANVLKMQWNRIGVEVDVQPKSSDELSQVAAPNQHTFDALLYGIAVGNDPDVFVFWHSSQASVASAYLNFSDYKNPVADNGLEAGRTRVDPAARAARYRPFLEAWRTDAPALGLYQPRYFYIARASLDGLKIRQLNSSSDRFSNVQNWTILTDRQLAIDQSSH